jgi:peptidoglycan/xylan/chitin deacetylase (PgdA/CDA1 family)
MGDRKYFIIKADDLKYNRLSKSWIIFLNILNKHNIPAALGLVGKSLGHIRGEEYKKWFLNLMANHEIFAHGYLHKSDEYTSPSMEEQRSSILKTVEMAKKVLKVSICSFGAPGNSISEKTREALKHTPINIWLFGMGWERINLDQRNFEFEYSKFNKSCFKNKYLHHFEVKVSLLLNKRVLGNCDFNELVQRYKNISNAPFIMGQIHPSCWSVRDLNDLERFLCFVLGKGEHLFITPKNLLKNEKEGRR